MTLRKLILILSALLVLIPSLILSIAIYQKVYRLAETGVDKNINSLTKQIEENITHQVEILATRITLFSQDDILISAISDLHYSRLAADALTKFGTKTSLIESLYLIDNEGFVIESYRGNIPVLEDSSIVDNFLGKNANTLRTMPSLWFEYFEDAKLLSIEGESKALALTVPMSKSRTLGKKHIHGALIAIIPIQKIMTIAEQLITETGKISFLLNDQLIYGAQPIISDQFINNKAYFSLLNPGYSSPFLLGFNISEPTKEITKTINNLLSPILTTGSIILIVLLILSMLVTNVFARSFNQLNKLIKTFKLDNNMLNKGFLITEFNEVSNLLNELKKIINQQVSSLKEKNNELATVNKQRETHLVEVKELNHQLEEKVASRTSELKETLNSVEHSHYILEQLITFRRSLENSQSNPSIAKIFIESISKCQKELSIALYLPEQYKHAHVFVEKNIAGIKPELIKDIVLTQGKNPVSIHGIMINNFEHHLCTFNVENNLLGWVILKYNSNDKSRDNWINLFIAELQSYLVMRSLTESLDKLASTDALTGLKNRQAFDKLFAQLEIQTDSVCTLYIIDVNGLKEVNDTQGHEHGDALIKNVANILIQCTGGITEQVFRIGGDEFAIMLNKEESTLAGQLSETLYEQQTSYIKEQQISFSFGSAASHECDLSLLYTVADKRMYQDKKNYYTNNKDRRD